MRNQSDKISVGIFYGGPSAEHEISIITALQAIKALDTTQYNIVPIYVSLSGAWYTGEDLLERSFYQKITDTLNNMIEVTLLPDSSFQGLYVLDRKNEKLIKKIPLDVCLLAFHGQGGEDGSFQGLFELANLPYTGSNISASSIAMNKALCKRCVESGGVPVLPDIIISKQETIYSLEKVVNKICTRKGLEKFPLFVKPCHLGSSIGISSVNSEQELMNALAKAFIYDDIAIIEPCIESLMEINISVLGGINPQTSVVEIPLSTQGALSYEDKYLRGGSKNGERSEGMASLTRIINPVDLDETIKRQVMEHALNAFTLLQCSGVCRIDFIFDKKTEALYFNELNPIPGSLSFYLWEKSDPLILYTHLLDHLINQAIVRHSLKKSLKQDFGFKALMS